MTDRVPSGGRRCAGTEASAASTITSATTPGTVKTPEILNFGSTQQSTTVTPGASASGVYPASTSSMGRQPAESLIDIVPDDDADREKRQRHNPHYTYDRYALHPHQPARCQQQDLEQLKRMQVQKHVTTIGGHAAPTGGLPYSTMSLPQSVTAAAVADRPTAGGITSYASLLSQMQKRVSGSTSPSLQSSSSSKVGLTSGMAAAALSVHDAPFVLPLYPQLVHQQRHQIQQSMQQQQQHYHHYQEHQHPQHLLESSRRPSFSDQTVAASIQSRVVLPYTADSPTVTAEKAPTPNSSFTPMQSGDVYPVPYQSPRSWMQSAAAAVRGSQFAIPGFLYPPSPTLSAAAAASAVLSRIAHSYRRSCDSPDEPVSMLSETPVSSPNRLIATKRRCQGLPQSASSRALSRAGGSMDGARKLIDGYSTPGFPDNSVTSPLARTVPRRGPTPPQPADSIHSIRRASKRPALQRPGAAEASGSQPSVEPHRPVTTAVGTVESHSSVHFAFGSTIDLGGGQFKLVQDLDTQDFVHSAATNSELRLDTSTVIHMEHDHERHVVVLGLAVGHRRVEVTVEAPLEHPFFVFDRGWSSCSPERTMRRYRLPCHRLTVGDCCISLTSRHDGPTAGGVVATRSDSAAVTMTGAAVASSSTAVQAERDVTDESSFCRGYLRANVSPDTGHSVATTTTLPVNYSNLKSMTSVAAADDGRTEMSTLVRSSPLKGLQRQQRQQASERPVTTLTASSVVDHSTVNRKRRYSESDAANPSITETYSGEEINVPCRELAERHLGSTSFPSGTDVATTANTTVTTGSS